MTTNRIFFDEGFVAGKSGADRNANPHQSDSNEAACWHNGWRHGEFQLAKHTARHEVIVTCPRCESTGTRLVLPDGSNIWDPDGYIFSIGRDEGDPDLPDEDRYCEGCYSPFNEDEPSESKAFANETEQSQNKTAQAYREPPFSKATDETAQEIGFVYVIRSEHVRIGKAKSESRYKSYKTSLPKGCEVLKVWKLNLPLLAEKWLHERYSLFRVHGSWYNLPIDKLKELLNITEFPKPSVLICVHEVHPTI